MGSFLNKLGPTGGQQSQGQSGPGAGPETRVWSGSFLSVGKVSSPPCGFPIPGPSASSQACPCQTFPGSSGGDAHVDTFPPAAQVLLERGSAGAGAGAGSPRPGWNSSKYRCHAANYRQRRSKLRNDGFNKFLDFLFTPTATWVQEGGGTCFACRATPASLSLHRRRGLSRPESRRVIAFFSPRAGGDRFNLREPPGSAH